MFSHIAYPEQLSMLTTVHTERCAALGISRDGPEGTELAGHILDLFGNGCDTAEALHAALERGRRLSSKDRPLARQA